MQTLMVHKHRRSSQGVSYSAHAVGWWNGLWCGNGKPLFFRACIWQSHWWKPNIPKEYSPNFSSWGCFTEPELIKYEWFRYRSTIFWKKRVCIRLMALVDICVLRLFQTKCESTYQYLFIYSSKYLNHT